MLSSLKFNYEPGQSPIDARKILVEDESSWRKHTRAAVGDAQSTVEIGRWKTWHVGTHELLAPTLSTYYTIEVLLGNVHVDCFKDGSLASSRRTQFGATQVAAPGQSIRCRFDRATEAIHLFIASSAVLKAYEDLRQSSCPSSFEINDPCFDADPAMGKLVEALAAKHVLDDPLFACYVESVVIAILARLIGTRVNGHLDNSIHTGLPRWRLRRAIDYIEANLERSITLSDIAIYTGLSRMHFAALFRRSTGLTPHNFLTARRVERAKNLLGDDSLDIVDISSAVGFSSQAHFTTVFRKSTGTTPGCWRRNIR